ncbi:MAG: malto-oligosyltrehalose trehalohydrolase, partial [Sphingobacteriales bacterium]
MNQPDIKQRLLGVNFIAGKARILVWAPFAEQVVVHNESTGAAIPLEKEMLGYWHALTDLIADDDLYRIALDGGKALPDPASLAQPFGVHGASQAVRLDTFAWTDQQWRNPEFGDYIIYELHPGTFSAEGNFDGIIKKLVHLRTLGINAIELMPVAQFPGRRNWGYDGVFPFAVQESYGGVMGLQQLVNTCHEQGFAVVLDVV